MTVGIIETLYLICSFLICIVIGLPLVSFSSVQHYMLLQHIYEDRCSVAPQSMSNIICSASVAAYLSFYTSSGLLVAIAVLPAFYALKHVGYTFTSLCGSLSLAAGAVLITDKPQDQWVSDKFQIGYGLVAMAAPFAIVNALGSISLTFMSRPARIIAFLMLAAVIELSPLFWPLLYSLLTETNRDFDGLFQEFLWVPCIMLFLTLVSMAASDSAPHYAHLLDVPEALLGSLKLWKHDNYRAYAAAEMDSCLEPDLAPGERPTYKYQLLSLRFVSLALSYYVHSLPTSLVLVASETLEANHYGVDNSYALTVVSPILAAVAVLVAFLILRWTTLERFYILSSVGAIALSALQRYSGPTAWLVASHAVGACRVFVTWSVFGGMTRCFDIMRMPILSGLMLLMVALLDRYTLGLFTFASLFDEPLLGFNGYTVLITAQVAVSALTIIMFKREERLFRRCDLESEARQVFALNP